MLKFEKQLFEKGFTKIAGADEVGRGCLAGDVYTGVVFIDSLPSKIPEKIIIRDSKKMTAKQRLESSKWIKDNFLWAIGIASVEEINEYGIVGATNKAYRRAIKKINLEIEHLLTDAFYIPDIKDLDKEKQTPIIKGDNQSFLIASASIIAKVERDAYMTQISQKDQYRVYLWDKNKGYGTLEHRNAIKEFGITRLHREKFVSNY